MKKSIVLVKKNFLRFKFLFCLLLIVIVIGILVSGISPYIYGEVLDNITQKDLQNLKKNLLWFLCITLAVQFLTIIETIIGKIVSTYIENGLKTELYETVLTMKCKGQDKYMEGELLNRLEFEVATIIQYYINLITSSLMIIFNFLISLFFLIKISLKLTILALFMFPLLYLVNFLFRKKIKQIQIIQRKFSDKYYAFLNESLYNLKGIKSFLLESHYKQKYSELLSENFKIMIKNLNINNITTLMRSILNNAFNIIILFVSAIFIVQGMMTIGSLVAFNTYLDKLFTAISKIMELNIEKQQIIVSFERIEELISQDSDDVSDENEKQQIQEIKNIRFEKVTFRYDIKDILKDFTVSFDYFGLYSIVGKNGVGKSTLLRLLEKFYLCSSGRIIVNDIDIKDIETSQLREQISYLAKETFVINDSVTNNLKLGNHNASAEDMREVCEKVGLHQDIIGFENGYDTMLGEGGNHLSSGQKQKLGLARILLRKSSLVLLDEATSDLDGEMEKQICRVIKELSKSKIVLNVSHRLEIVQQSNMVVMIDDGKVKSIGTPEELEKNCVYYRKLFTKF